MTEKEFILLLYILFVVIVIFRCIAEIYINRPKPIKTISSKIFDEPKETKEERFIRIRIVKLRKIKANIKNNEYN